MLPALVVVNAPVGIKVIVPPPAEIGVGAVIVTIAAVPEIIVIAAVGAIVVALAIVGAAAVVATKPEYLTLVKVGLPVQFVKTPLAGVPNRGVTKVGLVANTNEPEPVSSVTELAKLALEGVPKKVATFEPNPLTPVLIGKPVQFVKTPLVGVPKIGVIKVGVFANTKLPVPVSSVTAEIKLALEGVAKKVATFEPNPLIPVATGSPMQLVNVPLAGIPKIGAVILELVNNKALVN